MAQDYGNESIKMREGADRVRLAPQNFLGSRGIDGAKHTVTEIIGNATDEKLSGFGTKLIVKRHSDGSISVRDFGRGVPLGYNKTYGKWNYFLIYEELFAGGKYEDNQKVLHDINDRNAWDSFNFKDYPYLISIGMNGVGGACTQYTSEFFEVSSYSNGKVSKMYYEKGHHVWDELKVEDTDEPDGTLIHWKPDIEVFDDVNITASYLRDQCEKLSYTSGFDMTFIDEAKGTTDEFKGANIHERMMDSTGVCASNKYMYHCVDQRNDVCVCECEVAMGVDARPAQYFNNMIEIHGGSHSRGLGGALFQFFREYGSNNGVTIKEQDYAGKLFFLISTLANKLSVRGQTKDSLDDEYILNAVFTCVYNLLKTELSKGTKWFMDVLSDVVYASQLRAAQEELLKNHKEIEKTLKKHKLSNKFVSCPAYEDGNAQEVEFFIVEGDSAGGRVATARDAHYQCILPIRGKSLNVYKASIERLIANSEIKDMIAALGCGIDLGIEGYETFDMSKLKVGNIYFLADADIDGRHIDMLLFLIFYKLFPELLYQGKVWVIETPLYIINTVNDESIFVMTQEEMEQTCAKLGSQVRSVDRFKGLGEMDADSLWNTTLNPKNRHARQVKIERNDMELADVLEVLFGKSTERRKQAILGSLIDNFDDVISEMESMEDFIEGMNLSDSLEVEDVAV